MSPDEFWLWTYTDDRGRRVRSSWRMTAEEAAQYRDAVQVPGSMERRAETPLIASAAEHRGPIGPSLQDDAFRLLVCGGRDYTDREAVFAALDRADQKRHIDVIVHGGQRGADSLADEWASERRRRAIAFPADWAGRGPAAGPERNAKMLRDGRPDAVCAFPGGRGTADMTRRAEAAGLPIWRPYG